MEAQHLTKPARNYGIDLLRILSMIMIAVIHVIKRSEISTSLPLLSLSSATIWLLEIAVYGAVDCYALISGYVSYGRNTHKYANLLYLCLQALFYMVISTALMLVFDRQSVGMMDILATLFPFAYNTYWYFTAYFCLFFFLPTLNHLVDTLSKPAMTRLIVLLFTVFSLLPTLFHSDFPYSRDGYSFLWLVVLYLFGAYMRKYGVSFFKRNGTHLLGYAVCVLLTWASKLVIDRLGAVFSWFPIDGYYLIGYTSPTILIGAVCLLLFFKNLTPGRPAVRFAKIFAPVSFGVYLFHESPFIRNHIITGAFKSFVSLNPFVLPLAVLGAALGIWLVSSLVDGVRLKLFDLLRVRAFCAAAERKGRAAVAAITRRFSREAA